MSIADPRSLCYDGDFVLVRMALVDEVGWNAAVLLQHIAWKCEQRPEGWTATLADLSEATRLGIDQVKSGIRALRDRGWVVSERVNSWNSTLTWWPVWFAPDRGNQLPADEGVGSTPPGEQVSHRPGSALDTSPPLETVETKRDTPPTPSSFDAAFDRWWSHYPRKVGKAAARRQYEKAVKSGGVKHSDLLDALLLQRGALAQELARGFCPHPSTWLNQGRWEDDVEAISAREQNGRSGVHYLQAGAKFADDDALFGQREIGS